MSYNLRKLPSALVAVASIATSGCGGGGSSSSIPAYINLIDVVQNGGSIAWAGESRAVDYTGDPATGPVTVSGGLSETTDASLRFEAERGQNAKFAYTAGETSASYEETAITVDTAATSDPSIVAFTGGWNHMLYGVWLTGVGTGQGSFETGSFGQKTRNLEHANIPNSATYIGDSEGFYIDSAGQMQFTLSKIEMEVSFEDRDFSISSTETGTTSISESIDSDSGFRAITSAPELDFSIGTTKFSGVDFDAQLEGGAGSLSGSFYGESAQDVGGTFQIDKGSGATYGGSFGGTRVPLPLP